MIGKAKVEFGAHRCGQLPCANYIASSCFASCKSGYCADCADEEEYFSSARSAKKKTAKRRRLGTYPLKSAAATAASTAASTKMASCKISLLSSDTTTEVLD